MTDGSAERGRLVIESTAITTIAVHATLEVESVVSTSSSLGSRVGSVLGRTLPQVDVEIAGGHVSVDLRVATRWERPVADIAADVRGHVRETLAQLTGMSVGTVNVVIAEIHARPRSEAGAQADTSRSSRASSRRVA